MNLLQRLSLYCREQLHPGSRLLLSFAVTYYFYLIYALHFNLTLSVSALVVPSLSTFLLLVYYRISDEFKDYETDKKYFPDRPIPSGKLFLKDLKYLLLLVSLLGLGLNLQYRWALIEYLAAFVFTVLMGKWFFLEKYISKNRLLAFITHAPIGLIMYWYVIKYLMAVHDLYFPLSTNLSLIAFVVLPGFSWEILRKTYLPQDEMEGYQTYSQMLGFSGALLTGSVWIILTILNNEFMIKSLSMLEPLRYFLLSLNILLLVTVIVQRVKPFTKNLRLISEIYMGAHLLVPLAYLTYTFHRN